MKKIYLLCNAHLDPVWQWTWDEGLAEALSTFRIAADFCEEFDGFVFNHNEALLYEWVEEYDPDLFARIKRLVECGKWHIMGGWYLQPDCNMPSGESMLRQILTGRRYFQQKFGKAPTTAINFDPFGHSRGMVQLLAKCGFDSYIVTRPSREVCPVPAEDFIWVGYEGSEVAVHIANEGYNTLLGQATEKIRAIVSAHENSDSALVLWGVGNHGGGPSRSDLRKIAELKEEWESQGIELIHSTPEAFFAAMDKSSLPHFAEGLNPSMVGCYTSQVRIKQKHRLLENMLFQTEKMMAAAELKTDFRGDWKKIEEAEKLLLFSEFHDILPGSSIEKVEEESLRMLDHGIDLLQTQRVKAFTAFASMQSRQEEGDIPVIVYNPHPYPVSPVVECEFNLADQNWSDSRTVFTVTCDGTTVPSQVEKEGSNIPLDWRKKVTFFAELKPFSTAVYACTPRLVPAESLKRNSESVFELVGRHSSLNIDPQTGFIIIDEIYLLFQHEYSANFLFTLWKRVRKYGAFCTGITQNVDDLLQSHTARTMLANSEFVIMLNQASTDRIKLAELLNISDTQLSYITNVEAGRGLMKVGSALVPFVNKFPKNTKLYALMTTKFGER